MVNGSKIINEAETDQEISGMPEGVSGIVRSQ